MMMMMMMMMMIYFLQYLMHMDFVHDDWVVMVERTKLAMMESLPMAMQQKKFGTWMRHSAMCECIMESKQRCTPCTERGVVKPGKPLYMYMYVRHWSLSEANIMLHVHVCLHVHSWACYFTKGSVKLVGNVIMMFLVYQFILN